MSEENIRKIIAENIKKYREKGQLTKKNVAEYLGVTPASVTHWEDGSNSIDINKLNKLCVLFKCKLSDMVADEKGITEKKKEYSKDEQELIKDYRSLSKQGKEYIRQQMFMALNIYEESDNIPVLEDQIKGA